jgi:Asp-tRNA(Asn)/Glu-tRNA(Gln) amidotransferase A subunit family amidase
MDGETAAGTSASELARRLAAGEVDALAVTDACLEVIAAREGEVQAWQYLDPEHARAQARALDAHRKAGKPIGPLHGLPVGIKDIIDVAGMPTEHGTPLCAGHRPRRDAWLTARLRAAGAVVMGKTVTTELAVYSPDKTRNPHDPSRTPGGSSSGSAAAVAAGMVPLAVGTQTNGSVVRPAAFCGVVGYKPSFGWIPRTGVLEQSPTLDHIGVFARSVEDAALLADVLVGHDPADPATTPRPHPRLAATAAAPPPVEPAVAVVRTARWGDGEPDMAAGFEEVVARLGGDAETVDLPPPLDRIWDLHGAVMLPDLAVSFAALEARGADQLSDRLKEMMAAGRALPASDYAAAVRGRERYAAGVDEIFERFDVLLAPAVRGEAPVGLGATGDPVFCTPWTYLGLPALTLPLLVGRNGLPIGVQLVGRRDDDGRLLRAARRLVDRLRETASHA